MQVVENTSLHGLSSIEAKRLLEQNGRNEIPEKNSN
ncbi:MAG: cation-transporting P-type ATPase [Nitrosotalea sp.]